MSATMTNCHVSRETIRVGAGRARKAQANNCDHRADDDRRQNLIDPIGADQADQDGKNDINQASRHKPCRNRRKISFLRKIRITDAGSQCRNNCGNVSEGTAEIDRAARLGAKDVNKSTDTGAEQRGVDRQPREHGDEHCGAEHGENVLEAEDEPFARGRLLSNVNQEFFLFH